MAYTIARTLPKYSITKRKTVNVSKMTDAQKRAVFLDLNKKGYFVSYDRDASLRGCGVFNKGFYGNGFILKNHHNYLLMDSSEVYCLKLDDERLKELRANSVIFIGTFNRYNVSTIGDTIHIGCQSIPKDRAIKMAKLIIKGRISDRPITIGKTDELQVAVKLSRAGIMTYQGDETPEKSVKLAKAVLKAYKIRG